MGQKTLTIDINEELYNRFHRTVTDKNGLWRGTKQSAYKAIGSAVDLALMRFLDYLEKSSKHGAEGATST